MEKLTKRFLRYTQIHTTSDPKSNTFPSTSRQIDFAKMLVEELKEIGLSDVEVDEYGYVMATLPANIDGNAPVIGFIAHMDTSPDFEGNNVKPRIVSNYDGQLLTINPEKGIFLDPAEFPELKKCTGLDIITTDGTTLLGADDKAGIAEIISAMEILINSPEIKHGKIRICFTPMRKSGMGPIILMWTSLAQTSPTRSTAANWENSNLKTSMPHMQPSKFREKVYIPEQQKTK
jgi:tripeptide aminopeptidase